MGKYSIRLWLSIFIMDCLLYSDKNDISRCQNKLLALPERTQWPGNLQNVITMDTFHEDGNEGEEGSPYPSQSQSQSQNKNKGFEGQEHRT